MGTKRENGTRLPGVTKDEDDFQVLFALFIFLSHPRVALTDSPSLLRYRELRLAVVDRLIALHAKQLTVFVHQGS